VTVYADQVWTKSNCRGIEGKVKQQLSAVAGPHILIQLVDQVPDNARDYLKIVTDNNLEYNHIPLWPEFWGSFSYDPIYVNHLPTRMFNCFINRTCPIRQSWLYQFVRRGLLDQGYISFLLDYRKMPAGVTNKQELYEWVFQQNNYIFAKEHEFLRDRVPFRNFDSTIDLDQIVVNSCVSLVLETYFDDKGAISFSEKIFRSLQLPRPFILYASPGAVTVLRSQGFEVYDDVINHAYDSTRDPIKRQVQILDQLDHCRNLQYNESVLNDYENRAARNRLLLKKFKQQWPERLQAVLTEISSN